MIVRNALVAASLVLGFSSVSLAKGAGECHVNGKVDAKITDEAKCKGKGKKWVKKDDAAAKSDAHHSGAAAEGGAMEEAPSAEGETK